MTKYIFVTGGVVSGLGKGITASSIALLLKSRGYKVFMQKFDPYINSDPGLMSPLQHGEVFVTADGNESDLDLGHYERFIDEELNYSSSISTGKIYSRVIEMEKTGAFNGKTIQIVPHVTNEIKKSIYEVANSSQADFVITEVGGTIGDIESLAILESLRQIRLELGHDKTFFVHTTLVPYLFGSGELKTKPTQQSVVELRGLGIQPDMLVCRTPMKLNNGIKEKLSLFCSIPTTHVIDAIDLNNVYKIPINFHSQSTDAIILNHFKMPHNNIDLNNWVDLIDRVDKLSKQVTIALVGEFVQLHDAYLSVNEALRHAGYKLGHKIVTKWIDPSDLTNLDEALGDVSGIVIPYGEFNNLETFNNIINYSKKNKIPYLGMDLGFYLTIMNQISNKEDLFIETIEQKYKNSILTNIRIGKYETQLNKNSLSYNLYNKEAVFERHRHSLEFNLQYKDLLKDKFILSGTSTLNNYVDVIELIDHPFFIACIYRPEFISRPIKPHPLFVGLVEASIKHKK